MTNTNATHADELARSVASKLQKLVLLQTGQIGRIVGPESEEVDEPTEDWGVEWIVDELWIRCGIEDEDGFRPLSIAWEVIDEDEDNGFDFEDLEEQGLDACTIDNAADRIARLIGDAGE